MNGAALGLLGCDPEHQPAAPPMDETRPPSQSDASANRKPTPPAEPTSQPKPTNASDWVERLVVNHLGSLRTELDHYAVEYREPKRVAFVRVAADLPRAVRIHHDDGRRELLSPSGGWRARGHLPAQRLEPADQKSLERELRMLTAAALVPLVRHKSARLQGPGVLQLIDHAGTTWRVAFDPDQERVRSLGGPIETLDFVDWLTTSTTCLPQRVRFAGEEFPLALKSIGILPAAALFSTLSMVRDQQRDRSAPGPTQRTIADPTERPRKPRLQRFDERLALVLTDPGGWPQRVEALTTAAELLFDQGQEANGLPTYRRRENRSEMVIYFRPDPERMQPFVATADQRVETQQAHDAVVVCPRAQAGFDACAAAAAPLLTAFLKEHGLEAAGPQRAIPFVHPMSPPTERQLRRLQVRFEQPVR